MGGQPKIRKESAKAERQVSSDHGFLMPVKPEAAFSSCPFKRRFWFFLTGPSGPGLVHALSHGHLHLASTLDKVWAGSQTVHRATFSGLAADVRTEAPEGGSWGAAHLSNVGLSQQVF